MVTSRCRRVTYSDPFGLCPDCGEGDNGVRVRDGFWNRLKHGIYESCSAGANADCSPSPVMAEVPSFIGGPAGIAKTVGGLRGAAAAAAKAADAVEDFAVPAKHLSGAGGRWAKFADGVDAHSAIRDALRSSGALFRSNNVDGAFRVEAQLGRVIGTRGETAIRVIVGNDGRIWTAFPIK